MTPVSQARHPAPLTAIDRVASVAVPEGLRIQAILHVDPAQLEGHFPGMPVYPGVYLLESVKQALDEAVGRYLYLTHVRSARFLAALLGGDELQVSLTATPCGQRWEVTAQCSRGDGLPIAQINATLSTSEPAPVVAATPAPVPAGVLTPDRVRALLPQREPLLLIDRVVGMDAGRTIVAEKTVQVSEPCYRLSLGAYPISLMLESLGQAAALLWLAEHGTVDATQVLMFAAVRRYRVLGSAQPAEVLRHTVELIHDKADTAFASGRTCAGGRMLAEADTIVAVRRPRNVLGATRAGVTPRPEEAGR